MLFKRFYDDSLAQASYLIACEHTHEAIVVDPALDVEMYIRAAADQRLRIAHVTETHIHADFVSGAHALASAAGAVLHLSGEGGKDWGYSASALADANALVDGSAIAVGDVRLTAMHTPGHTPEHLTFLVSDLDRGDEAVGALTGDFIFVGDVGRPDLLERSAGVTGTTESSARDLYRSIRRFLAQPDHLQLWPGHGAGSACGKSLGSMPQSTLGYERLFNWALASMDENEFVRKVLDAQPAPPRYFGRMKRMNQAAAGFPSASRELKEFDIAHLEAALRRGATVIDTRPTKEFASGHIPGTLNIPRNKSFLNWFGSLVDEGGQQFVILSSYAADTLSLLLPDLSRIGASPPAGYFSDRIFKEWSDRNGPLESTPQVNPDDIDDTSVGAVQIVDVRGPDEWNRGHIPQAIHIPLAALPDRLQEIDARVPVVLHCQGGGRSSIAASFLKSRGIPHVSNLAGGYAAWVKSGLDVERDAS